MGNPCRIQQPSLGLTLSLFFLGIFPQLVWLSQAPYGYSRIAAGSPPSSSPSSPFKGEASPYELDHGRMDQLFEQFKGPSLELVNDFKRDYIKLFQMESQHLDNIHSEDDVNPTVNQFVIEHPPSNHQFPHFDNLKLITFPKPNLNLESSGTQLLVSVDYYNALRVFQFFNQSSIYPMEGFGQAQVRFQMNRPADQFECVKIRAFVLQPRDVVKVFRLMVVVLFRRMPHVPDSRNAPTEDLLDVYGFNGEYGRYGSGVMVRDLKPISLSDMRTDGQALQPEQLINFDKILDFDVLSTDRPNAYYMALIRMELGTDSNSRYKLLFYHMLPGGTKYDQIAYHESDYILNAHRVKLAQLNNQIHLICSYSRDSSHGSYGLFHRENSINVFRYSPPSTTTTTTVNSDNKNGRFVSSDQPLISYVTSVQNETYIANVIAIHHLLDGEDYFYLVTKYSVVVYWWDGGSLIYYDTLLDRSLIKAFNVGKRKELPPLIVSSDGRSFSTHINEYGQVRPDLQPVVHIPDGFEVKRIEVFNWANNYFVWTLFHRVVDYELRDPRQSYATLATVGFDEPRDSRKIMSYKRCMRSMEEHIEKTITQVKTLTVKSDDILVINKANPVIPVRVKARVINVTMVPDTVGLDIPSGAAIEGRKILDHIESTRSRLKSLADYMRHNVVLRSTHQSIASPVHFEQPVSVQQSLKIDQMNGPFMLNGVDFETYTNDSLMLHGDQVVKTPMRFDPGLEVDELEVDRVNGRSIKDAITIIAPTATHLISATHHYSTIELLNGTTAPAINDVPLVALFQDQHHPIQLMRTRKHFRNLTVPEIQSDNSVNGLNLHGFLSNIIWLDGSRQSVQRLSGSGLVFAGGVWANQIRVNNLINGKMNIEDFYKHVARTDGEVTLKGPIYFDSAHAHQDVKYRLLNGLWDLARDAILLHSDQDFSHLAPSSSAHVQFDSIVHAANVSMGLMNGYIRTEDFVLRSDLMKAEYQYRMMQQDPFFVTQHSSPLVVKKTFNGQLWVKGDVELRDGVLLNGVDLSDLFERLDTVKSFNTELKVEELEIGGNLQTKSFNEFGSEFVEQILTTRLRKSIPQMITLPVSYNHGRLNADELYFNYTASGGKFPTDYIHRNESDPNLVIFGSKYFTAPVAMNELDLGPPSGLVNGHRISQLYASMVKNDTRTGNWTEEIGGMKSFKRLKVIGDVWLQDGLVNECYLDKAILLDSDQRVLKKMTFESVKVEASRFEVKDLTIKHLLSGHNFPHFLSDVVIQGRSNGAPIALQHKHFPDGLVLEELNATVGTVGHTDLKYMLDSAIMIDTDQDVYSKIEFNEAEFEHIAHFGTINKHERKYFESVVLKSASPIHVYGAKDFHRDLYVNKIVAAGSLINEHNLTQIAHNSLMVYGDQIVTGKHVFLKPVRMGHLMIHPKVRISDRAFEEFVLLDQKDIIIESDVVFDRNLEVKSLTVHGLVGQCNLTDTAQHSIYRNPIDHHFHLTTVYNVPQIVVLRNLQLPRQINGQPNFIPQIGLVDDARPYPNGIRFETNVIANHLVVNARTLVNQQVNVSHLLNDAVYVHVPQHISGHKVFRKPLTIVGSIFMKRPEAEHRPELENHRPERLFPQLRVSGSINRVNISNLLTTTVLSDRQQVIRGNKVFTGRIRFRTISTQGGLNGNRVPEDYHLRVTDETITGETYFEKRVHVHENVKARLINHVDLNRFVANCIFVNDPTRIAGIPQHQVTRQLPITSSMTFVDGVYIRNLTVFQKINDIPVGDLVHRDSNSSIYGYKIFSRPIRVEGNLHLGTVNSFHFERDLKNQWIDAREGGPPVRVTGSIRLTLPVDVDQMVITDSLNDFGFNQFTPKYFDDLNAKISWLNESIGESIGGLDKRSRSLEVITDRKFLIGLRYFHMIQNFEDTFVELSPLSHLDSTGAYRADNLFGAIRQRRFINSTFVCDRYQTRYFEVVNPYLNAQAHTLLPNIPLKIRDATPEYYGKVSSHYNMIPMVITPVSGFPSDGGQFVLYSIYTQKEVCYGGSFYSNGRYSHLDGSGLIGHQLHYFTGKFFIGYQNVILDLAEHDVTVRVAKAFRAPSGPSATGSTVYYLVLLLQSVLQPEANHRVVVYRVDVAKRTLDRVQSIHYSAPDSAVSILDLDLTLYAAHPQFESSILLSLVYDGPSSVLYPNAHAQSNGSVLYSAVMKWNTGAQLFQSYMSGVDQYRKYSPSLPYRSTRFFSNFWGTFLAFSTVGRDVTTGRQGCTANFDNDYEAANFVDIWHYTPEHAPQGFELYQRLDLGTVGNGISGSGGGAIETLTIGADFYLLTLSGDDHLLMYQHRGVNQFELMAKYRVEGATSVKSYWYGNTVYLTIGSSSPAHAQLLAGVVRSMAEQSRHLEGEDYLQVLDRMKSENRGAVLERD